MYNQKRLSIASGRTSKGSYRSSFVSQQARDVEFQFFIRQTENEYPPWWTRDGFLKWFQNLPDNTLWNTYVCSIALCAIVWIAIGYTGIYFEILDVLYNVTYAIHVFALGYYIIADWESSDLNVYTVGSFLIDLGSFSHYVNAEKEGAYKLICYYFRLHRPFRYLWALNDYNLKGSVLGTTLKYCYIFLVLRVTWALIWLNLEGLESETFVEKTPIRVALTYSNNDVRRSSSSSELKAFNFLTALYMVNKMFIPIGPSVAPGNDQERILCLMVMLSGCLVVTGAAVASLSLVISLYMRPEETFRSRYRLIMKEMKESHIPQSLRDKVETFYKMYWHKQRAVSATQLLPTFPPTLPATIYSEIYFEFIQKSRILRDLSYQFLSELAKKMETINYIPGDAIIKRTSQKSSMIYVTYGDIEMLTAEDDTTAILRMTRGTLLSPAGCIVAAGCGPAHLEIIAATFCTAHVLRAADLWAVVLKHSTASDHSAFILSLFNGHLDKVKNHFKSKVPVVAKHKSSILCFKRNLMALKEAKNANGEPMLAKTDLLLEIAGHYLMRNRADASLTDESDKICLRPTFPCILQPNSSLQVAWHSFVAALIMTVCISHPYHLVYLKEVPLEFRFFDYAVTAVYVLDLIVHLSTGANVEEGVPITFSQTSSQQCRNYWFVLDVLGTLPIFEFVGEGRFAGINKILRIPKVFRVLKSMEDTSVYSTNVVRFLTYTLLLLIACFLVAALQQGFLCYQFGYCVVTNFTHSPYWEHMPIDGNETFGAQLTFGLYWSISMITFTAHKQTHSAMESWNNAQRLLYTMFVLEISIVMRIFMEAIYSATIMVTTSLREDFDACIETVKNFLISNQVDPTLRQRFINYLQLSWYTDKAYSMTHKKNSIFHDLPAHVYQDIVARQRMKYILSIPFMRLVKKEILKSVSSNARLFYISPNEILLNTGDLTNEMYVIKQGICEILSPDTKSVIGDLTAKHNFGVLNCLLRLPAFYTIRTVTHVQVFSIPRKQLLEALEMPQIRDALEYCKEQPEFNNAMVHRLPFITYQPPEPTPNMERFRLPRKHEVDYDFLHPFDRLGFLSVLRYIFPRFTIRPDGQYLLRYEWFRAACAMATSMLFPSYTYLVLQWPWLYYVTLLLDISAWFDIFQRMLIGYFNEQGILVYHPSSTAAHYMKGAFIVDLFACLSLEHLEGDRKRSIDTKTHRLYETLVAVRPDKIYTVTPTKQFLMLNRLIQLYRLQSVMSALPNYLERRDMIFIIKSIPIFLAVLNVLTCFMVFYSVKIYYWEEKDVTRWLIEPFKDAGGSWIVLFEKAFRFSMTATPWNLHLAVHFWMVYEATTTGYNIFNPSNFDQMEVLFIGMACSSMIITYFSVRIISVRANVNKALAAFQEHMKDIMVFMRRENFEEDLQKEVQQYYEYSWDKMGGIDYRGVLKLCDQITLRTDAILNIYGPTFAKCPILNSADISLLRIVGRAVRSEYFLRGMQIIQQDDVISDMYFVDYGGVDVRMTTGDRSILVKLPRGSVFGNLEPMATDRCPMTLVAMTRVHLLMINSRAFHHILSDFPAVHALLNNYRQANKYYIMGNVTDHHKLKRQASVGTPKVVRSRRGLIKHMYFKDSFVHAYLIFICLACVYADFYNAGFQDNRLGLILCLYILDMCFYFKILMHFCLPLLVDSTISKILIPMRKKYYKGEFRYDIASCIPFELLSFLSTKHRWLIFSWLRLNRTLRIMTVYRCLKKSNERITVNLILSTVFAVLIWFSLFVHSTSCLWYFMALMHDEVHANSSWIHKDTGDSWCYNSYVCSLYFVLTTFTQNGVGDIVPKNHAEVVFVSVLMIVSTLVYMVYVGEFSNLIQYQYFRSFTFYSKYLELQEFSKNNRVSKNLASLVNRYSLHIWRESRGLQVPHFLKIAPHSLHLRIMSAAYIHHIDRHHIFEDCEPAFIRQLVGCLKLYTYNTGMFVVKESEITNSMYLIHTGKVRESTGDDGTSGQSSRVYPSGSYFGVLQGLIRDTPYIHSYQTLSKAQVLTLCLDKWEYLLAHFPLSKAVIHHNIKHVGGSEYNPDRWPGGSSASPKVRAGMSFLDTEGIPPPPPQPPPRGDGIAAEKLESDVPLAESSIEVPIANDSEETLPSVAIRPSPRRPSMKPTGSLWSQDQSGTADEDTAGSSMAKGPRYVDDSKTKMAFMDKVKTSAKRLLGKPPIDADYDESSSTLDATDDLLLQEDEETTEALLKQYQKKGKYEPKEKDLKDKFVKVDFHESSAQKADEEDEEHMATVDMTGQQNRSLRIASEAQVTPTLSTDRETASKQPPMLKKKIDLPTRIEPLPKTAAEDLVPGRMNTQLSLNNFPYPSGRRDDDDDEPTVTQPTQEDPSKGNRKFVRVRYDEPKEDEETITDPDALAARDLLISDSDSIRDLPARRNIDALESELQIQPPEAGSPPEPSTRSDETNTTTSTDDSSLEPLKRKVQERETK